MSTQLCTQPSFVWFFWVHARRLVNSHFNELSIKTIGVLMAKSNNENLVDVKLTDLKIRSLILSNERFEGKSAGGGLYLRFRISDKAPVWRFRYRFAGKPRVVSIASYTTLSLADARKVAKEYRARVSLGYDVAGEKQERKKNALGKIEDAKNAYTVNELADEYFERNVLGRVKHPNIVRSKIEKDIKPTIGNLKVEDVRPQHIDALLQKVVKRGAPTVANDVLRLLNRMFNHAIKRHVIDNNPVVAFDISDAGGKEESRTRYLKAEELITLFKAIKTAKGFSIENEISIKLLLALGVRKEQLTVARWSEIDLINAVWVMPIERTKTNYPISIPLSPIVVTWFKELQRLSSGSDWVLPARKMQERMIPHISPSTINTALGKVKHGLEHFTVHDLRRTARTHLESLGVSPHVAERCLNHKIKGIVGVYNRYDYFEERKAALNALSDLIVRLENGDINKVVPINNKLIVTA